MHVFLNGTKIKVEEWFCSPLPRTLAETVEFISGQLWHRGLVIEKFLVDEKDYLTARLAGTCTSNISCLEINAIVMSKSLIDIVVALNELLPTIETATQEICVLLDEGQTERAMAGINDLAEAFESIGNAFTVILKLLPCKEFFPAYGVISELERMYPLMVEVLEKNDLFALKAIMKENLLPALKNLLSVTKLEPLLPLQ